MIITFYDSTGLPIAYSDNNMDIFLFSGQPVAYVSGESIYSFKGTHLGRFRSGWIRDNNGACVFFTSAATGGPMKPMKSMKPMKGMKSMKPMKGMKSMKPMRPMNNRSWSTLSGEKFFFQA